MKKVPKILSVIIVLIFISLTLFGCGASKSYDNTNEKSVAYSTASDYGYSVGTAESAAEPDSTSSDTLSGDRKLVKNANLTVQTKTFDDFISKVEAKTTELKGYVENSSIDENDYYNNENVSRYASLTLRIPAESLDEFMSSVSDIAKIINKSVSVNDITTSYIDTESHIKALETEQKALLEILEKSSTVENTIKVYERLSEVNASLDSYKSTLKSYDNMVSYSTVELYVNEVERITEGEKEGFFAEVKSKLSDNLYSLGKAIRSFGIWFLSSLPMIAIGVIIIIIVIILIKKIHKKRKSRKENIE